MHRSNCYRDNWKFPMTKNPIEPKNDIDKMIAYIKGCIYISISMLI